MDLDAQAEYRAIRLALTEIEYKLSDWQKNRETIDFIIERLQEKQDSLRTRQEVLLKGKAASA